MDNGDIDDCPGCLRQPDETAFDWSTLPIVGAVCLGAIAMRAGATEKYRRC